MGNTINSNEQMISKINEVLQNKRDAIVNIVNDKLTISVFALLEQNLKNVKEINLVIRDTKFIPQGKELAREFEINPIDILFNSYDICEKNNLQHFAKAKAMHDFIKKHVNVRKVNQGIKIGTNIIIIDDDFMIQGSSSLEVSNKAAMSKVKHINFDTMLSGTRDREQIVSALGVYHKIWYDEQVSLDYKKELLKSLQYVYKEHAPEFLYYFTLNELFGYQMDLGLERFERDSEKLKKTQIWNMLYDFQRECVVSAIQKLHKYGGCIIADSVGLGKTFEALAVIKYFEIRLDKVLVLTPAKLYDNWNSFKGDYKGSLIKEPFNYRIMFHTDLSRYSGESKSGQDLKQFDWGDFDLVVIDESHNFRNRNDRYDENDQLIMTRYARLLQDVIKKGKNNTKVLLLSATPVNNSLVDLKNQLSIITKDEDFAFADQGITSVENLLRRTSAAINDWEKQRGHKKEILLDSLPSDFYKLLEMMTIARSRKHITSYYGDDKVGRFPDKNIPRTIVARIDKQEKLLQFKEVNEILGELNLSIYIPASYIKGEYVPLYAQKYKLKGKRGSNMNFAIQAEGMIILHRFNLFKRLESSVYAFAQTLERMLNRMNRFIEILERGGTIEQDEMDENDEEIIIEGKYQIDVRHLRRAEYLEDLENDREVLQLVYEDAMAILGQKRDYKIEQLKEILHTKISEMPYNHGNKKILIFSAFADTVNYIYESVQREFLAEGVYTASITGSRIKVNNPQVEAEFNTVLSAFSPQSKLKQLVPKEEQIDILVGTDCISEGQNLQDCDTVINFDIQWNPVSLIQRFGRIDRIGSTNSQIQMINFFPVDDLNEYLGLEQRVKGKMTTLNLVSTGDEDILTPEMNDFKFRKRQLERLKDEVIDIEDANENISLTDLNMNEYIYELSQYIQKTPEVTRVPKGVYSVTAGDAQGVLFCFKHRHDVQKPKSDSSLYPYYLIYMKNDGEVMYGNTQAREALKIFRKLCYKKEEPVEALFNEFFVRTKKVKDMSFYTKILNTAIKSIKGQEEEKAVQTIFDFGGFNNSFANETVDDFELISFLVVESC